MKQILSSQNLSYLLKQAILCYEKAEFDKSLKLLTSVLKADAKNFDALHLSGVILAKQKKFELAIRYYEKAIKINSKNYEIHSNKASCLRELKQYDKSLACYDRSIELNPNNPIALQNKANLLREIKKNTQADLFEKKANQLNETLQINFYEKGNIHLNNNENYLAIKCFDEALKKDPHLTNALINRGNAFEKLKKYSEALDNYAQALRLQPNSPQILSNKAAVLHKLGQTNEALNDLDLAINLDSKYLAAWLNKSVILEEMGDLESAIKCCNQVILIDSKNEIAYSNRSSALKNQNRMDEALKNCDIAIQLNPNFYTPIFNKALINLHLKKFHEGWIDYEVRTKLGRSFYIVPPADLPIWKGKACNSLLIYGEEGVGDEIFFSRMLKKISNDVNQITVLVHRKNIPTLSRSFPKILFLPRESNINKNSYDSQILVGSLPKILGDTLTLNNETPYLKNDIYLTNQIRVDNQFNKSFICGLSWRSSEKNGQKNIKLRDLEKIITLANCQFVNLQYGDIKSELSQLDKNSQEKLKLIDSIDLFNDIEGLFSLVAACDLVITTSNVTAHVAGAIGKECILLAPYSQGRIWYWHQEQISSWYPTIRIFSQDSSLSWAGALDSALSVLKNKTSN
jgi:tetratricopeptide (TPR) repeat protein